MTKNEVLEEAREVSYLQIIELTTGSNGYPQGLGDAGVIGFDDFEEAEEFAHKYGCEVSHFKSKLGWNFWQKYGQAYKPYTCDDYLNDLGDDYSYANEDDVHYINNMKEIINNCYTEYESLTEYIKDIEIIKEHVESCRNGQRVIVYGGKYYETVEATMMRYYEDADKYAIGVLVPHYLQTETD